MRSIEAINTFYKKEVETAVEADGALSALAGPLQFVYGFGPESAAVALIGEAPGKDEVRLGRPFVGKAGAILDEILNATGIERESLYITNIVKYRLARPGKRPGTFANRPASPEEIKMGLPWLREELLFIKPKLILTLGNVPLKALCFIGNCAILEIGACHGKTIDVSIDGFHTVHVPLYHPASQIYNRSLRTAFDEDFKTVRRLCKNTEE
ncbi:MAG: uracil-DNA glycosylase [Clostridia bacterium]